MSNWKPPPFNPELAKLIDPKWDEDSFQPQCCGYWYGGSGGHRQHKNKPACTRPAVWWHPWDVFSYCELHVKDHDRKLLTRDWLSWRYEHILKMLQIN